MEFKINNTKIGPDYPTYIIAELSCNHNGDIANALKLIHEAKNAGANAIKIQTYTPDTMTLNCDSDLFKIKGGTAWDGETLYELYKKAYTPWEWHEELKNTATKLGLDFFSSPFDVTAVDFLDKLGVPCYKIASFEAQDHILLKKIASMGKPIIISTGVSELDDITESLKVLRENGATDICVLKCTSAYPAPIESANLKTILDIAQRFGVIAGLSDHTTGIEVPIGAVCLGAQIIEKHFTLSNTSGSPDDGFSLEPDEFAQMVDSIRKVEKAIGSVEYKKSNKEKTSNQFKRSLFVVKDIKKDEIFTDNNIRSIRPGFGLHTRYYDQIIGKKSNIDLKMGTPMKFDYVKFCSKNKILFLGYNENKIITYLKNNDENISVISDKIKLADIKDYDFVISYGYTHIVRKDVIDHFRGRIINLHISFLPWNKGRDPNLWSFLDNTPKGVTIHQMDEGLDTGDIIIQQIVDFDESCSAGETLESTYQKLKDTIEDLFINNWEKIVTNKITPQKQDLTNGYSLHRAKDKNQFFDKYNLHGKWDIKINRLMELYKNWRK